MLEKAGLFALALFLCGCETQNTSSSEAYTHTTPETQLGTTPLANTVQYQNFPADDRTFATAIFDNTSGRTVHAVIMATRDASWRPPGPSTPYETLAQFPGAKEVTLEPGAGATVYPDGIGFGRYDPDLSVQCWVLRYEFQ
jgi:hypothetical protein